MMLLDILWLVKSSMPMRKMPKANALPVDILIKDPRWSEAISDIEDLCADVISMACGNVEISTGGEVSIAFMNDADIRALNHHYRGKDKATNVLSFPAPGPALILGDIVMAYETTLNEAKTANKPLKDHMIHLLVHGFLHLLGYDHEIDAQAEIMEALEIKILGHLNIDNPYKINELDA